jgi:hypothetical protein
MSRFHTILSAVDHGVGDNVERIYVAHHERRLRRLGQAHALHPLDASLWVPGEPPPREGTSLEVLIDGAAALPRIAAALQRARSHVMIAGWSITADFALARDGERLTVRELLADLAARGCEVRVLLWAGPPLPLFKPSRPDVRRQRDALAAGTRIKCALDAHERPLHTHHEKLVVIDDEVAFVGGQVGQVDAPDEGHLVVDDDEFLVVSVEGALVCVESAFDSRTRDECVPLPTHVGTRWFEQGQRRSRPQKHTHFAAVGGEVGEEVSHGQALAVTHESEVGRDRPPGDQDVRACVLQRCRDARQRCSAVDQHVNRCALARRRIAGDPQGPFERVQGVGLIEAAEAAFVMGDKEALDVVAHEVVGCGEDGVETRHTMSTVPARHPVLSLWKYSTFDSNMTVP